MLYLQCKVDFHTGPGKKRKREKRKIDYLHKHKTQYRVIGTQVMIM